MSITFYDWWFSIVIDNKLELHIQVGWLTAALLSVFALRGIITYAKRNN